MINLVKLFTAVYFLVISTALHADDIDILGDPSDSNILFVLDLSGSMGWGELEGSVPSPTDPARVDSLRNAFKAVVNEPKFDGINFGLSVFSGSLEPRGESKAHGISYPVSSITDDAQDILSKPGFTHPGDYPDKTYLPDAVSKTSRQYLSLLADDAALWATGGFTPIADALYEAAIYFRGEEVKFGRFPPRDSRSAHPATYDGSPFRKLVTSTTPACTAATRVPCRRGSCGPTEAGCTSITRTVISPVNTGGCTLRPTGRRSCAIATPGSVVPTCGAGTNCVLRTSTRRVTCNSSFSTIAECTAANPTFYNCVSSTRTTTTPTTDGATSSTTRDVIRCSQDVSNNVCDGNPRFSCPRIIQRCTMCPPPSSTSTVLGTANYISPIKNRCSYNSIILLSDGEPTVNKSANLIKDMIGSARAGGCNTVSGGGVDEYGRCAPELAEFLANVDQVDGSTSTPSLPGDQTVVTNTIGFALGGSASSPAKTFLEELANKGKGIFLEAHDLASLTAAFEAIISQIPPQARSFSAPSYSVDSTTLLTHGDSVYVPMFDKRGNLWPGNLKKFKLANGELKDADGNSATDADGNILETARDLWSDPSVVPSDIITSGGAANKINPAARLSGKMLTNIGPDLVSLTSVGNDEFGSGTSSADKAVLLKFISGTNPINNLPRNHMGDIIHSKPVQLEMASGRKIVFIGTNEGFLHAINDSDGTEAFAFMPRELIKNIKDQYAQIALPNHIYGVDSPITMWIDESYQFSSASGADPSKAGNGIVDANEKAYIFFGLRRGGKGYYALNVTDPDSPKLLWAKSFGSGGSWSQPVVEQLKWKPNLNTKPVLVIGGGYTEDGAGTEIPTNSNAVYIVDALDGTEVWSTKVAEADSSLAPNAITHSVPSKIRALDVDRNGSIDRLYFGDTGGNLWRADLNAGNYASAADINNISKATLHKFAELGGSSPKRKFFEEPSVAIFKYQGQVIASIAIGSGDRTDPLDASVDDKFFVVYDKEILSNTVTPTAIAYSDLSSLPLPATHNILDPSFKGWAKDLTSTLGEKTLSTAVTYDDKVLFTTFGVASSTAPGACQTPNQARFYVLDLNNGHEYSNVEASSGEILGTPQVIFPEIDSSSCSAGSCSNQPVLGCAGYCGPGRPPVVLDGIGGNPVPEPLKRVYWYDSE